MKTVLFNITLFASTVSYGQKKLDFCKKWDLNSYVYWGVAVPPEENEQNDFIHFNADNTYTSLDEGKYETGYWEWNAIENTICLFNDTKNDSVLFQLEKLTDEELIVMLKDDDDAVIIRFNAKND